MATELVLRWRDSVGNPQDLGVTQHPDGSYRLDARDHSNLTFTHREELALPIGDSANIFTETVSTPRNISGFLFTGNTDAVLTFKINGVPVYIARINIFEREKDIRLPAAIYCPIGANILATVSNEGAQIGDFQLVIYEVS